MVDESNIVKKDYYDLSKYKSEIASFIKKKKTDLDVTSKMQTNYNYFNKCIFAGTETAKEERYPHAAENFKVYKSAILESSLSGYSALLEIEGLDGYSQIKVPELKKALTKQFKEMSLIEKLSGDTVNDWILKGESISMIKFNEDTEEYRIKEELIDAETNEPVVQFKVKQFVTYENLEVERINPFDFFVDAYDYEKDPRGCVKIVRSYIDCKTLLTSNSYPMLTLEDKQRIVAAHGRNGNKTFFNWDGTQNTIILDESVSNERNIEVLTFYGDYVTSDNKVLSNIIATTVDGRPANLKYSTVNTNRLIYAEYYVDEQTHRGVSPLCSTIPVNTLANRAIDMFLNNLNNVGNPIVLAETGTMSEQQYTKGKETGFMEYNPINEQPVFWSPPPIGNSGLQLLDIILQENKNLLGLNQYMAGDNTGVVRTARESSIINQKANARMRVETDMFNYRYMLNLFNAFYSFNRELALVANRPLDEIFKDESLKVMISTNASRADKEGEFNRLMNMLNLPLTQMIFSNLTPEQVIIAVQYLMAKAELTDFDNILQLVSDGENKQPTQIDLSSVGVLPPMLRGRNNKNVR